MFILACQPGESTEVVEQITSEESLENTEEEAISTEDETVRREEIIFEGGVGTESREPIQVEAYCGYKTPESPRSFIYRGERHLVLEILGTQRMEKTERGGGRVILFRVKADDGNTYQLGYDERAGSWFIET